MPECCACMDGGTSVCREKIREHRSAFGRAISAYVFIVTQKNPLPIFNVLIFVFKVEILEFHRF